MQKHTLLRLISLLLILFLLMACDIYLTSVKTQVEPSNTVAKDEEQQSQDEEITIEIQ